MKGLEPSTFCLCRDLLGAAAHRASTRSSSVHFGASRSTVQVTRVRREEADALVDQLLAIVVDSRYQEPLRPFWEDDQSS